MNNQSMVLRDKFNKKCFVTWKTVKVQCDWEYYGTEISINGEELLLFDKVVSGHDVERSAQYWLDGNHHPSQYLNSAKFQYLAQ